MENAGASMYGAIRFDISMLMKTQPGVSWTPGKLRDALGLEHTRSAQNALAQTLFRMVQAGDIFRLYRGSYMWAQKP